MRGGFGWVDNGFQTLGELEKGLSRKEWERIQSPMWQCHEHHSHTGWCQVTSTTTRNGTPTPPSVTTTISHHHYQQPPPFPSVIKATNNDMAWRGGEYLLIVPFFLFAAWVPPRCVTSLFFDTLLIMLFFPYEEVSTSLLCHFSKIWRSNDVSNAVRRRYTPLPFFLLWTSFLLFLSLVTDHPDHPRRSIFT
jgi:hypothetical protein